MDAVKHLLMCYLSVSIFFLSPSLGKSQKKQPHIVFILADDLGWSDVGFHNPYVKTPHIDALAREGVILNQSYVSQSCGPSRAALMSGYYSYRLGFQAGGAHREMPVGLSLDHTLLPAKLQHLGYTTYMVGKWHLGHCKKEYTPNKRGFHHFYGYYLAAGDYYTHFVGNGLDLHDNFDPDWSQNGTYSSELYTGKAVDFIDNHDKSKPMFMYVAHQNIHSPLMVPEKYLRKYRSVKDKNRRTMLGMLTAMDHGIGKLVKHLKRRKMWENTLLVFSTDNGGVQHDDVPGSNWPLFGEKQSLYEGSTRAVSFIHGSMLEQTGHVYDGLVHIVDWYPTLVTAAGGRVFDNKMDGVDVWRALSTNTESPRTEFIYNIIPEWQVAAIRKGDYKLINGSTRHKLSCWFPPPEVGKKYGKKSCRTKDPDGVQLFNLKDDPLEKFNLAEEMPDKVRELNAILAEKSREVVPAFDKEHKLEAAKPRNRGNVWNYGWC